MKRCCFLAVSLVATGCASYAAFTPSTVQRIGESPPLNERVERSVGEVVYETFNYQQIPVARLGGPLAIDVFLARASIPSGTILEEHSSETYIGWCTRDPVLVVAREEASRVCLADRDSNGRFESWYAPEGPPARQRWQSLKTEVPFSTAGISESAIDGFRYELLYQGISGNVVSLLYREYLGDLVRPAFQQDLIYTLSTQGPTEVSFRRIRIRIYAADNNSLTYELLSGLDSGR